MSYNSIIAKRYRQKHKEMLSCKRKEYYLENKEQENNQARQYYQEHRQERVDYNKLYSKENPEVKKKADKRYAMKHKEEIKERKAEWYLRNRNRINEKTLKVSCRKHKITVGDYNRLFQEQQGCCAICGTHQSNFDRRLDIDHNHKTKRVRGLLCSLCNGAIGMLKDDAELLIAAYNYLRSR